MVVGAGKRKGGGGGKDCDMDQTLYPIHAISQGM